MYTARVLPPTVANPLVIKQCNSETVMVSKKG